MRSVLRASTAVTALALVATAGGAHAANGNARWTTNGISSVKGNVVSMSASPATFGSSVETASLGRSVAAGDVVSFDYALKDAVCVAGAPRAFIEIGGVFENTFDSNPNACGAGVPTGAGATAGTVAYTIQRSGVIGAAGVVFDTPTGSAVISNFSIAGKKVVFGGANGK